MNLICPAGIGDVAWVISKIWSVRDQIETIYIVDGKPRRTVPFVELAGFKSDYYPIGYNDLQVFEQLHGLRHWQNPTWEKLRNVVAGNIAIEANEHLECGKRLEDWLPDLPAEFHFPLNTTEEDAVRARKYYDREMAKHPMAEGPVVAISAASVQGAEAWRAWLIDEWKDFLQRVMAEGWRPLIIGGDWDDLSYAIACDLGLPDLVGKMSIGVCIEFLKIVPAYIGYSSGLNVIRTILDRPAMAIWPHHQNDLRSSWAPPDMVESHRYESALWTPVPTVWPVAKRFLRLCETEHAEKERYNGKGASSDAQSEGRAQG